MATGLIFDGIAGSQAIDSSGEVLDIKGADITHFEEGKGFFNYEHVGPENGKHHPGSELVGKVVFAKKIFKESDCENERQRKFFKEVKEIPYIYVVGRLFDQAGHEGAKALAAIMRDSLQNKEPIVIGMSVEGSTLKREGNELKESVLKTVALTVKPCNKTAKLEVIEDPGAPKGFDGAKATIEDILASVAADAKKMESQVTGMTRFGGWASEFGHADMEELEKLGKAMDPAPESPNPAPVPKKARATRKPKAKPVEAEAEVAPDKNLVVSHNLSQGKLLHADKLGGLAAPSLAISHKDHPLENFGEVTLIGGHELVDPEKGNLTFNADIYSPRHPRGEHQIDRKAFDQIQKWLQPYAQKTGNNYGVDTLADKFKEDGPAAGHGHHSIRPIMGLAYLEEKGHAIEPPMIEPRLTHSWANTKAFKDFLGKYSPEEHDKGRMSEPGSQYHKEISDAAKKALYEYSDKVKDPDDTPADIQSYADLLGKRMFDENGLMHDFKVGDVLRDAKRLGNKEVDRHAYEDAINDKVKELGEPEFKKWAEEKLKPMDKGMVLPVMSKQGNWRHVPYNLQNIVAQMKKEGVRGAEGFNYGLGSSRAQGAKQFKTLAEIREGAAKLVSPEKMKAAKDELDERFGSIAARAGTDPRVLSNAIGESYKRGGNLKVELSKDGIRLDPALHKELEKVRADLLDMPTEYFETKQQRPVGLNEFKGAVVPHDVLPETLDALKRHGIQHIEHYHRDRPETRKEAIQKIANAQSLMLKEMPMAKTMTAGNMDVAPSSLSGGAALQREDIARFKPKAMKTLKSYLEKNDLVNKEELKAALKAEVPEASDDFLNHFADVAEDYTVKMRKAEPKLEFDPLVAKVECMVLDLRKAMAERHPAEAEVTPHIHHVYGFKQGPDGKTSRHAEGRYMTAGNHLNILEDYHGELGSRFTEGRIGPEQLGQIAKLKSDPGFTVASKYEIDSGARPELWEGPEKKVKDKKRSSFAIHRKGHDLPDHLEFILGQAHLNGNPISEGQLHALKHYVGNGHATVRYMKGGNSDAIHKMEAVLNTLMKAHDPAAAEKVHAALGALDALVAAGHLPAEHAEALRNHAFKDPMTGNIMGNKFAHTDFLNRADSKGGVHVAMDGNDFKSVNDKYGHEAGDQAIKAMGGALRAAMDEVAPGQGKLFRAGGDEFSAHFPTHEHAAAFARAVQKHMDKIPPINGEHKLSMGFGFGDNHHEADKALYEAKKQKYDPAGMIGPDSRKWVSKYKPGEAPHLAHSLVNGHEGPVPLDTSAKKVTEPPAIKPPKPPKTPEAPPQPAAG